MPKGHAQLERETVVARPGRIPLGVAVPGGTGVPVREARARAERVMHPRSAIALRIEDSTPIENILVCRRCPVLASLGTSLGNRVEVVSSFFCAADRDARPSWPEVLLDGR